MRTPRNPGLDLLFLYKRTGLFQVPVASALMASRLGGLVSEAVTVHAHRSGLSLRSGKGRWHWEAGSCHSEGCCGWSPGPATHKHVILGVTSALFSGPQFLSHTNAELGPMSSASLVAWTLLHHCLVREPSHTVLLPAHAPLPLLTLHCYLKSRWFGSLFF